MFAVSDDEWSHLAVMSSPNYLLALALLWASASLGKAFPYEYGVVTPADPFKFVGENLTLDCNITNENLKENSSMLGFQRATLNGGVYTIPNEFIRILTSKAIRLFIPKLKLEDDGNYSCFQKTFKNKLRLIGNQKVFVDNRPKRIESIDCSVYNWENMTCRWSLGVHFQHPDNVNVVMKWVTEVPRTSPSYNSQEPCPELTKTSCGWPSSKYQHASVYIMALLVQTVHLGKVVYQAPHQQFKIETEHYIQPAPIRDFQAEEENSTCIRLSWKHSTTNSEEKTFEGRYLKAGSKEWKMINMSLVTVKERVVNLDAQPDEMLFNFMSVLVCGLTPFTNYTFSVSVLPYSRHSDAMNAHGRRSDWISVPATTREDVPGIPPPQCTSCFFLHTCPHPTDGRRCVRIYWGETPVSHRHGKLKDYSIRFERDASYGTHTNRSDLVPGKSVTHDVTNADFTISDVAYKVKLTSSTVKGPSPVPSVLSIPSKLEERPSPPVNFLVEKYNHPGGAIVYNLTWDRPSPDLLGSNITVVWCMPGVEDFACKNYIQWTRLPGDSISHEMIHRGRINIGVAREALLGGRVASRGIVWASCIYNRNQRPKRPEDVRFSKNPPNGGLTVQWRRLDCAREKAFVVSYNVSICVTQDGVACYGKENMTGDIRRTEFTFLKLNVTEHYLVRVWAKSKAGFGLPSVPINATVAPYNANVPARSSSDASIVIIIIVIPVFVLIVLGILFLCVRFLVQRYRKSKESLNSLRPHAESMNRGSSGRGSFNSSDNSFPDRDYHYPFLRQDQNSSSGHFSDPGNSSRSISTNGSCGKTRSRAGVYSMEQTVLPGDRSARDQTTGSDVNGKESNPDNHPATAIVPPLMYETPVMIQDSSAGFPSQTPLSFNEMDTLPIRNRSPSRCHPQASGAKGESSFIVGRINDNPVENASVPQQLHKKPQHWEPDFINNVIKPPPSQPPTLPLSSVISNSTMSPSTHPPPPPSSALPPSSLSQQLPTIPPRQPLLDNPPLNNAPPPPKIRSSVHQTNVGNPSNNDPGPFGALSKQNIDPTSTCSDCDRLPNHSENSESIRHDVFPSNHESPGDISTPLLSSDQHSPSDDNTPALLTPFSIFTSPFEIDPNCVIKDDFAIQDDVEEDPIGASPLLPSDRLDGQKGDTPPTNDFPQPNPPPSMDGVDSQTSPAPTDTSTDSNHAPFGQNPNYSHFVSAPNNNVTNINNNYLAHQPCRPIHLKNDTTRTTSPESEMISPFTHIPEPPTHNGILINGIGNE